LKSSNSSKAEKSVAASALSQTGKCKRNK
jgi:hypothetical protein